MAGYKEPGFQDRVAAAAEARAKALERLKAKPPVDPAVLEARAAKAREREELQARRSAEKAQAREEARKIAEAKKAAAIVPEPTEAERKAARDARYAARKARKSSR